MKVIIRDYILVFIFVTSLLMIFGCAKVTVTAYPDYTTIEKIQFGPGMGESDTLTTSTMTRIGRSGHKMTNTVSVWDTSAADERDSASTFEKFISGGFGFLSGIMFNSVGK